MTERRRQAWAKWQELISEQSGSGQSVAAFCRERGLCAPHFFAWKKRLREQAASQGEGARSPGAQATKFVEVKLAAATRGREATTESAPSAAKAVGTEIEIGLGHGRSLRVRPGFDADH